MEYQVANQQRQTLFFETSGGTVANYEAMSIARNLRSIPYAMRKVMPGLVSGMSDQCESS